MEALIAESLENSYSYTEYRNYIAHLLLDKRSTGHTQSEDLTNYSTLNEVRMNRLDKTIKILPEISERLKALKQNYILLIISEGWCGDAAQIVPVIEKIAQQNDLIEHRIILRDDNDALMNKFLTNGGRAIPKLIVVDTETNKVLGDWGPRPEGATHLIIESKAKHGTVTAETKTDLQKWYLKDKGYSTMAEITALLERIAAK